MKFTSYASRIHNDTAYIFGGRALDFDTQGGLEEIMTAMINTGVRRIVLTLRGMHFLHYTLFAGLLATQQRLESLGGDLILAETPEFVRWSLRELEVLDRFALVPHADTVARASQMTVDLNRIVLPG